MLLIPTAILFSTGLVVPRAAVVDADPAASPSGAVHVVMVAAEGDDDAPRIVKLAPGQAPAGGQGNVIALRAPIDGSGQSAPTVKMRMLHPGAPAADLPAGGPWIGVQFGPVPKALSAHLNLTAESGQMVLNVAEGSPADLAGLQQYDVITTIDGKPAPSDMSVFLDVVRGFAPNETHVFTVLRGSQQIQANLTVAARPAPDAMPKFKYESGVEEFSQGRVFGRGGLMEKDDTGNWVFKGFDAQNPPDFFKSLPGVMDLDFDLMIPHGDGQNGIFLHKTNGEEIRITTDANGQVTVTKTVEENGVKNTTTTTYASREEFEQKEPDLAKKFSWNAGDHTIHIFGGDGAVPHFKFFDMKLDEDMEEMLHEHLKQLGEGHAALFAGRPLTRFELTPDGKIKVITRQGEDELTETFDSAADLEARRPDLYQKYQRFSERTGRP
ncbi:MAG: hypothetical protein DCC65_05775 [Planctomycetota bacterium]|nr:MAG: hypothetical protein DCC65_05775 [Planctomycetota bacterium]